MLERRDRILRVARKMIAESGAADLNVRDLCARAGIAQRTLYNAFGSKDHVITLAVQQYTSEFNSSVYYKFSKDTLEGQIEAIIKVHSRNIQLRSYTTAIMSVYNSPQSDRELRDAVRKMAARSYRPFIEALAAEKALQSKLDADRVIEHLITCIYAILTDWCIGDLQDELLVERVCEVFLMIVAASTKGKQKLDAERWLSDLRNNRPSWRTFRTMADVEPGELRAAFLQTQKAKEAGDGKGRPPAIDEPGKKTKPVSKPKGTRLVEVTHDE